MAHPISSLLPGVLPDLPAFLEHIEVALIVQDHKSAIVYANHAALKLLGRTKEQVLGVDSFDPAWDVIRPNGEAYDPNERPVLTVLRTGQALRDVVMGILHPRTGQRMWLSVDAAPHRQADGALTHVVVTLTNISEQRHRLDLLAETTGELQRALASHTDALHDARAKLALVEQQRADALASLQEHTRLHGSVVAAMAEGVAVHRSDGAIVEANPAAGEILGLTREQLLGREAIDPRWALTDERGEPLGPEQIPSEITRATGQACRSHVLGVRRPDGTRAWLSVSTEPLAGPDGQPTGGVVATFADITSERTALMRLQASRAEFERLTQAIPGVLWQMLLPTTGPPRFLFLSARVEEMIGVPVDAAMADANHVLSRVHPEDRRDGFFGLLHAARRGEVWQQDVRIVTDAGAETGRFLRARAVAEQRPEGTVWNGVALDVTEERKLAEQLRHSQRREAMGDLAAGVAHNFNNMLAAIIPNLQEALALANGEAVPVLRDAIRVSRDGAELVRQLLQMSRREPQTTKEPVDAVQVVSEIAALCNRSFKQAVTIHTELETTPMPVLARSGQLQQVLLNLCINARDSMEECERRELILSVRGEADAHVVIRVQDSGSGMNAEVQRHLGEPFFTTKPIGRGTGLGLATAFSIVDELGGQLRCESTVGVGTTFTLVLPRLGDWQRSSSRPTRVSRPELAGHRVLVVDDEELVRRAITRRLKRHGLELSEAQGGAEALAIVEQQAAQLSAVLLDMSMPGMGGLEVLEAIRRIDPQLPVVIMTGHIPDGAQLAHAAGVLTKPAEEEDLLGALGRAFAERARG